MTRIIGGLVVCEDTEALEDGLSPIPLGLRLGELKGSYELVDIRETMTSQVVLHPL